MQPPALHFFVCTNPQRAAEDVPGCGKGGGAEVAEALRRERMKRGLAAQVYVTETSCLGLCPARGATVVVYPDAVWYSEVLPGDAVEIAAEHIDRGRPVDRLRSRLFEA